MLWEKGWKGVRELCNFQKKKNSRMFGQNVIEKQESCGTILHTYLKFMRYNVWGEPLVALKVDSYGTSGQ